MANRLPEPPSGFDDLPVSEQIEYVEALWDRIPVREHAVPLPEAHRAELEHRLAKYDANPDDVRSWALVESELRADLAKIRGG